MKRASSFAMPDVKRQELVAEMHYDFTRKLEVLKFPSPDQILYPVPGMSNVELLLRNRIGRVLALPPDTAHYMSDVLVIEAEPEEHVLYAIQNFCACNGPLTLVVYTPFYFEEECTIRFWDNLYSLCEQNKPCILVLPHISRFTNGTPHTVLLQAMFDVNRRRNRALSADARLDGVWTIIITQQEHGIKVPYDAIAKSVMPTYDEQHRCVMDELRRRLQAGGVATSDNIAAACAACTTLLDEICVPLRRSGIQGGMVVQPGIFQTYERIMKFVSRCMQEASDARGSPVPLLEDMRAAAQSISDMAKEDLCPEK